MFQTTAPCLAWAHAFRAFLVWPIVAATVCLTAGCGGGGSSAAAANPPPSGGSGSAWMSGVFMPSGSFAAQCAAPRSGTDPATQQAFPDLQGTVLSENNWLRSWSNELYLWYDEIVDRDPALYATAAYFDLLRTNALTPSGSFKDQFHFTHPTAEWQALSQSGVSAGYGVEWAVIAGAPPREAAVLYTEPDSPAATAPANLARGARLIGVDGVDFVNDNTQQGLDAILAGLFPGQAGETHEFEVQDLQNLGTNITRKFTIESANVTSVPVHTVDTIVTPSGATIGYLLFNDHIATAEQALIEAVADLDAAGIDDLVLDIRYNGGGFLVIASQLAYMIAGPATGGRVFEEMRFNAKHPSTNPVTGQPLTPLPFVTTTVGLSTPAPGEPLPTLDLPRVFVLTGSNTCSASESIINGLLGVGVEVVQIGATTCGKPYGFYPQDNCGTTYFSIQFQGVNAAGFGDYADGFTPENTAANEGTLVPGCSVGDDYAHLLGDPAEARLAAALAYRENPPTCPPPTSSPGFGAAKPEQTHPPADGRMLKSPWRENRILVP